MPPEICIEHRYPEALTFLRHHGPQALAVLHDLLTRAEVEDGQLIARASTRDIATRLEFLSKDSVHRRLRQLTRAGFIEPVAPQPEHPFRRRPTSSISTTPASPSPRATSRPDHRKVRAMNHPFTHNPSQPLTDECTRSCGTLA